MKRYIVVLFLSNLIVLGAIAAEHGAKGVDEAWAKAMKANSAEAAIACYAKDAVGWFPGEPAANGEKAIRASYEATFAAVEVKDVTFSDTKYKTLGDISVGWGRVTISIVNKATKKADVWKARYTDVAERRDGRWVYIVDHASVEPEPPKIKQE